MAESGKSIVGNIDWLVLLLYLSCVTMGWLNIYAVVYTPEHPMSMFDLSNRSGQQLLWIGTASLLIIAIMVVDHKFYDTFAYVIYGVVILLLVAVLFMAADIKGSRSWIKLGNFSLQPAEFAKLATSLALAKYLGDPTLKLQDWKDYKYVALIIGLPAVLILLSNETGTTLVFASFLIMLYREGLPGIILVIGIVMAALLIVTLLVNKWFVVAAIIVLVALVIWLMPKMARRRGGALTSILFGVGMIITVLGVDFFINDVLQKHQSNRIRVLIDPYSDPQGAGWNVIQSKIAIGSGGLMGKGFLQGTQTKFDFVPEQDTDFIFCTVGEEHGFVGALVVIGLFMGLISRLVILAERQRTRFGRVYGYCVAGIFLFHFLVNIGMTIGFMPVIGIPLPFFSYGGSSLWGFTILLFIFLKIDSQRPFALK
ncbi:rod shape-determining protein RodA [Ravibacter arvi]|uniref:Rod shape-determining protein RodA n=1 Tax=Ravibacter arvi TaxID=2051041 RepID=A0ABP8M084_9BACT